MLTGAGFLLHLTPEMQSSKPQSICLVIIPLTLCTKMTDVLLWEPKLKQRFMLWPKW